MNLQIERVLFPYKENPENNKVEKCFVSPCRPIYGFYHIFAVNHWKQIFNEQISRLRDSGLFNVTDRIYISLIGSDSDKSYVLDLIGEKGEIIWNGANSDVFEFPALEALYIKCQKEECFVYYFHTKGSSNSKETLIWYKGKVSNLDQLKENSRLWRRMMEYWIFDRWKLAIASLQLGYNAYGCLKRYYSFETQYYGGNFWWTRSEHVKTRELISDKIRKSRYNAETWILSGGSNYYCCFTVYPDSTAIPAYEEIYKSSSKIRGLLIRMKYTYKYVKFAIVRKING